MSLLTNPKYDPDKFIDHLIDHMRLKNDTALARALGVHPPAVSKIRNRRSPVSALFLLRAHEVSEVPIRTLRNVMGDTARLFETSPHSSSK